MRFYETIKLKLNNKDVPCFVFTDFEAGDSPKFPRLITRRSSIVLKRGNHKKELLNIYAGFDIETTNVISEKSKTAYMYIWQMAIASDDKGYIYLGRKWDDFIFLLNEMQKFYDTGESRRVIIWDANFGFEFQFLRKRIEWSRDEYDFFAREIRRTLLAVYRGLEFRDCLAITGGSLEQLASDYCTTQKLKGDLDYSVLRNSKTPLDRVEMGYCINDVAILAEFGDFAARTWIAPNKKVPLTKTGLLRAEVKREFEKTCKNKEAYLATILNAFPNEEIYAFWFKYLFRGGFVHANFSKANVILWFLWMLDITSSYPAQMNLREYPVTPFKYEEFSEKALKEKCCILIVEFWNVKTVTMHSIESKHKLIAYEGVKLDNGRVYQAEYIKVALTELDFDNYRKFYKWEKMNIVSFQTSKKGRLPKFIRGVLNRHYLEKHALKAAGLKDTPKYALVKSAVNAAFGLMVTRISMDKVTYSDDWQVSPLENSFEEEKAKQILLPQWGIWVAAHGRHELLSMIHDIEAVKPNAVAYGDTDSVKCEGSPEVAEVIRRYNAGIADLLKKYGLTDPAFSDLGMFAWEGCDLPDGAQGAIKFKTIGAKRYIYEDDKGVVHCTVAGLPKEVLPKATEDIFEQFDIDGLTIPCELSEKLTTCYNDEPTAAEVDGEWMSEESSVALYSIPFSMFTEKDYYSMIVNQMQTERRYYGR